MNWYKYWYYTIFFIYDAFGKNSGESRNFSVMAFSAVIYCYVLIALLFFFGLKVFDGIGLWINLGLIVVIYLINGALFWSDRRTIKDRTIYREINTGTKNLIFISLSCLSVIGSMAYMILLK